MNGWRYFRAERGGFQSSRGKTWRCQYLFISTLSFSRLMFLSLATLLPGSRLKETLITYHCKYSNSIMDSKVISLNLLCIIAALTSCCKAKVITIEEYGGASMIHDDWLIHVKIANLLKKMTSPFFNRQIWFSSSYFEQREDLIFWILPFLFESWFYLVQPAAGAKYWGRRFNPAWKA